MNDLPKNESVRLVPRESARVWPMLLRAGAMSVHPGRVLIGMMTCLVMLGAGLLFDSIHGALVDDGGGVFAHRLFHWRYWLMGVFPTPSRTISGIPLPDRWDVLELFTLDTAWLLLLGVLAGVFALGSGAMARMVGVDVAADADMSTRHAVRFSMARWTSLLIAHWVPIGLVLVAGLLLGVFGLALLSVPGVSVLGAALFGLAICIGAITMAICLALLLGGWMLAPAVVCESTDGVDAIQRCFAYVYKRIGHTLLYLAILIGVGLVAFWIVRFIVLGGYEFAAASIYQWISDARVIELHNTGSLTARLFSLWRWFFELLVSGWVLSYTSTGATLMYLALRRVCDDQDPRDLWMEAGRREPIMPEPTPASARDADQELA